MRRRKDVIVYVPKPDKPRSKMTKKEVMADNDANIVALLKSGFIKTDPETGKVFSKRTVGREGYWVELKGSPDDRGYIRLSLSTTRGDKIVVKGHRVIWISVHGIPPSDLVIDHINRKTDDNRLCNLRLLNNSENAKNTDRDLVRDNKLVKLNDDIVKEIRRRYAEGGITQYDLADEFHVRQSTIWRIIARKSWKGVEPDVVPCQRKPEEVLQ